MDFNLKQTKIPKEIIASCGLTIILTSSKLIDVQMPNFCKCDSRTISG